MLSSTRGGVVTESIVGPKNSVTTGLASLSLRKGSLSPDRGGYTHSSSQQKGSNAHPFPIEPFSHQSVDRVVFTFLRPYSPSQIPYLRP